jgi:hypothetical protein
LYKFIKIKGRKAIGYTQEIGGVCSNKKYSIIEYTGFNQIQNAAHELAHIGLISNFYLLLIKYKHLIKSWCYS